MVVSGQANVTIDLHATSFTTLNPKIDDTGTLHRVTFYADQPSGVGKLLKATPET